MAAEGSGSDYAKGAAHALWAAAGMTGEEVVEAAINAAIRYDSGCGGDAWTLKLEPVEKLLVVQ